MPKPFHSHLPLVLVFEPLMQRVAVELQRPLEAAFALDLHDGVGVPHHLDQTHAVADGETAVRQHPWWETWGAGDIKRGKKLLGRRRGA